jgi:diguanylate cyclase (GGDEF)-like protein
MAIVFVDLDNFKLINDSYGHHTGDLLLRTVAERLTGSLRSGDIVSRLGGDEFAIIIESIGDPGQLPAIAEKLIHCLTLPLSLDGNSIVVSGSLGIAVFPEDAENADVLLRYADMAMYAAKGSGKNTWRRYSAAMSGNSAQRLTLESRLRNALQENQLELHYQPQIDVSEGRIKGFEALVRWNDPENGLIGPLQFIPVAEECGLINPIGEWVLRTACQQARAWHAAGIGPMRIAVNVSARQLSQLDFAVMVIDAIEQAHCPPELIELEITESAFMQYGGRCESFLELFRTMKLNIAIDDFGTGYSSMSHLKHLPVTKLKIDKSFIDDIAHDAAALAIAHAIAGLAHNLEIGLVAEGVEHEQQAVLLQQMGCNTLQGYYLARPMKADDVPAFWRSYAERAATSPVPAA